MIGTAPMFSGCGRWICSLDPLDVAAKACACALCARLTIIAHIPAIIAQLYAHIVITLQPFLKRMGHAIDLLTQ